ncbi:MAG: UDP-N-acetylglucosamine--N-acetylmuramyl-(pentapeptide) pyrophosphoryl-undecaprenol N-acetylglucosamine transferase, partial [Chthoniobacterales bacterium]
TQALKGYPEFRSERLPSIGLPSVISPAFLSFMKRMWESVSRCREVYRRNRPGVILGMGGFTSMAPVIAGRMMGIPTLIHESNAIPGRANKKASRFVHHVLLGLEGCKKYFPNADTIVTGTPIRSTLGQAIPREEALAAFKLDPARKTILVMGGSQGATGINQLLFKSAPMLANADIQIIHLTGDRDDQLAAANYLRDNIPAYVASFHHRMAEAYSAADLAVSRAGAASISELSAFGIPSILIPYPYATDNHQEENAKIFAEANAALLVKESETGSEIFTRLLLGLLEDDHRRMQMSEAARAVAPLDAAQNVANVMERIAK